MKIINLVCDYAKDDMEEMAKEFVDKDTKLYNEEYLEETKAEAGDD
tara:strand:+ start:62171 stop:62308 length:138 start_codon:yes stop_codon:yes gene_type:complete